MLLLFGIKRSWIATCCCKTEEIKHKQAINPCIEFNSSTASGPPPLRLYSDGNVGFYAFDISYYYRKIASEYAEVNDAENTLKALTESCKFAIIEANLKDMNYTAPMVNRMKHTIWSTTQNYKGNACNLRLKALEDKRFDFLRNDEVFKKIIADLKKYAE